jgi:hypothetical protein
VLIGMPTDCWKTRPESIVNVFSMKNSSMLMISVSENFLVESEYIDDVLSLNNSRFGDFVDLINPIELEIKDTIDTTRSPSYLDLHLEIDSEDRLRTNFYDKGMISILILGILRISKHIKNYFKQSIVCHIRNHLR